VAAGAADAARCSGIGILSSIQQLADWLDQPARDSDPTRGENRPSRAWFGAVHPGTYAPIVDSAGVDGKLAGIAAIHAHDAAFDEVVFLAQVQRLFFAVLEAWTAREPALSQGVMGSVIWEEQKAQIDSYRTGGWRNVLDQLRLISAIVAGAQTDGNVDTLTVRINASSADYDVDAGGQVIKGSTSPQSWTEDWIFQRPATLTTASPGTISSEQCPSCGARVTVDITTICPYCDAAVISGHFGWSLTRIERVL
jgi:predicted lipid-binding transport protein (Tim44 family)